jgi:hypothetical protein
LGNICHTQTENAVLLELFPGTGQNPRLGLVAIFGERAIKSGHY